MKNKQSFYIDPTISHLLIGVGVGAAVTFAAILVCAFILTLRDFEPGAAAPMSNICMSLGAAFGGFTCASLHRSKGLLMGAASGLLLFAIISVIALFVSGTAFTVNTLIRVIVMPVLSAAGGVVGVNRSSKRKMI